MTRRLDRFGELVEDDEPRAPEPGRRITVRDRCDELRRIIRETRARQDRKTR